MSRPLLVVLCAALCLLPLAAGCPDDDEGDSGKRVIGSDGRERWVVTFGGPEPDLAEYRSLLKDKPEEAEAYAEKMRKKLSSDHADFESSLESIGARVVERWRMSNSMTVEVEAAKAASLEKQPGVKSLAPDVSLDP